MTGLRILAAVILPALALLAPGVAEAHLIATGMGPVYDGVTHFALSPEDILPVVALALFAGLKGPVHARAAAVALAAAWFAGGALALGGAMLPPLALAAASAAALMALGGLLASNLAVRPLWCAVVGAGLGLARGLADMSGVAGGLAPLGMLLGVCASVAAAFVLAASLTLPLRRFWMVVAARVAGSWIAALGLLLAGWILRYGAVVK